MEEIFNDRAILLKSILNQTAEYRILNIQTLMKKEKVSIDILLFSLIN